MVGRSGLLLVLLVLAISAPAQQTPPPAGVIDPKRSELPGLDLEELMQVKVVSASRLLQSPMLAPAKVVTITAREIRDRGYDDLEEILHDYAGFDFEKGFGSHYSQIYMRGERSTNSDRFLFLWDGVLQNDIWAQVAWFDRQYPLDNIERIEIMYGPASLLYGANAMSGIINVITRRPEAVNGLEARARAGPWKTYSADLNYGKSIGDWRYMFNGRWLQSEERDLTRAYWTDNAGRRRYYGLRFPDDYDLAYMASPVDHDGNPKPVEYTGDPNHPDPTKLRIMKNGEWHAFDGRFGRDTADWFVEAGVGWKGFDLKAQRWVRSGSEEGWTTPQSLLKATWDAASSQVRLSWEGLARGRWKGRGYAFMRTSELVPTTEEPDFHRDKAWDPTSAVLPRIEQFGPYIFYKLFNREYRAGGVVSYEGEKLSGVLGSEVTNATVYENYYTRILDSQPWRYTPQHRDRDAALYANVQSDLGRVSLSGGLRYDYNWEVGGPGGFGSLVTGRAALIYLPNEKQALKVLYGEAFQEPPVFKKYSTNPNRPLPNPGLQPERLRSLELAWETHPNAHWKSTVNAYWNVVRDKIELVPLADQYGNRFENHGRLEIFGSEIEGRYLFSEASSVYANITANRARDQVTGVDPGGIAPIQTNFGLTHGWSDRWTGSLRGHWVAGRRTARWNSTSLLTTGHVDPYFTLDGTLTFAMSKRIDLRLNAYNLTNAHYYDPGARAADGEYYNAAILQQPLRLFFGVSYRM